jgi:hypothetical protein
MSPSAQLCGLIKAPLDHLSFSSKMKSDQEKQPRNFILSLTGYVLFATRKKEDMIPFLPGLGNVFFG